MIFFMFALVIAVFALCTGDGKATTEQECAVAVCVAKNADGGETKDDDENKDNIPDSVDDLLDKLDFDDIQGLVDELDSDSLEIFGFSSIVDRIRAVSNGEIKNDFGGIVSYVFSVIGIDILKFLPMMLSVLAIILAYNVINSVKGRFASSSTEKVVYFATGAIAICVVVGYFASIIASAVKFISSVKTQINAVAPVLMTLMTASGAKSSAGVYTPSIAILGSGMTNAVTYLAFPALLMGLVFDIIGSISTSVKLEKTAEFFRSACKWFLGTAFFLFIAVIGVSGITASVQDGVSVRAARFAVSKYVPVIGGYLSQGFDFVMAGNVLIKNALGSSAVILIVLTVVPIVSELAVFTLTLKLTAAIAEPLGGEKFSNVMSSIAKSSSMIAAVVIAMAFLYILFLSMIICTGNIGL